MDMTDATDELVRQVSSIPHELGSSAGSTRIFRFAYFEHPSYVPLMRLSFARWQALEQSVICRCD